MPNDNDGRSAPRDVSRRHLFKQVGLEVLLPQSQQPHPGS